MDDFVGWLNEVTSSGVFQTLGLFALACLVLLFILGQVKPHEAQPKTLERKLWLRALGRAGWVLIPLFAVLFIASLIQIAVMWTDPPDSDEPLALRVHYLAIVGFIGVLGGILAALAAYIRIFTTERQTTAQEQGLITDRINKAVENLGATRTLKDADGTESHVPNLEVRIGGIYALERIAQDSLRDHIQIMEILTGYVRTNFPAADLTSKVEDCTIPTVRIDLQTVASVLARRSKAQRRLETERHYRLVLNQTDLSGVDLSHGDFSGAGFTHCRLLGTRFDGSKLRGARLIASLLDFATFDDADLTGCRLDVSILKHTGGGLGSGHTFARARNIVGLVIAGADLTGITYLGRTNDSKMTFGSADTQLGANLQSSLEETVPLLDTMLGYSHNFESGDSEKATTLREELADSPFLRWSPFGTNDLMTWHLLNAFHTELGLVGFPYSD